MRIRGNKVLLKALLLVLFIILLIVIDQAVKICIIKNMYNSSFSIIKDFLRITYVENTGGAFGIGSSNLWFFIIVNIIIIGLLIRFLIEKREDLNIATKMSVCLIIAGGIGNFIDRVFRGFVVDYIEVLKFPVFNFADICVVLGAILIIITLILNREKE